MKTLKTTLVLILLLLTGFFVNAQTSELTELTASDGTSTSYDVPINGRTTTHNALVRAQMIYKANELEGMRGSIKKIAFHIVQMPQTMSAVCAVRIMNTPDTSFTFIYLETDDATQVYTGDINFDNNKRMVFDFDTPFEYNGGHLLIEVQYTERRGYGVDFYGNNHIGASYFYANMGQDPDRIVDFSPKITFYYEQREIFFYTITVTAGAGGSINPGTDRYPEESTPKFTITPDKGYEIDRVLLDATNVRDDLLEEEGAFTYTFAPLNANHTLLTTFKQKSNSIQENSLQNVQVYSHGNSVYIINESQVSLKSIEITDITGRVAYSSTSVQNLMNLNLTEGVYIVRLMSDNAVLNTKVILKN